MPAVVQHLSGLVDSLRRRVGGRDARRPRHADARRRGSASPARARRRPSCARRSRPASRSRWSRETEAARIADDRRAARHPAARGGPGQPGLRRSRARGCGWAAARSSSASTPSACPRCSPSWPTRDLDLLGFHIFAGSQNLNAELLCEAQRKTVELALRLADAMTGPVRYLNLGGGFGIPYFEKDEPLDLAAIGENLARPARPTRSGPNLPEARVVIELGRYLVGEAGFYVTRVARPQGVARQDLPRRRRRPAPPARRLRQLRPGDPPQLPGGDRRPDRRRARPRPSTSSAASARRSTCSPTTWRCRRPGSATSSSCSSAGAYGLTASPTAFLGHPAPAEVLV